MVEWYPQGIKRTSHSHLSLPRYYSRFKFERLKPIKNNIIQHEIELVLSLLLSRASAESNHYFLANMLSTHNLQGAKKKRLRRHPSHHHHTHQRRSCCDVHHSLLILLCIACRASICASFTLRNHQMIQHHKQSEFALLSSVIDDPTSSSPGTTTSSTTSTSDFLPNLYPQFANILTTNGYIAPTPIQHSSAPLANNGENILLIAATGSGKTLAYLLPALSRAAVREERKTVLIVAPTRELAAQLARDASLLLPDNDNGDDTLSNVVLAVRGIPPPTPKQISQGTVLVGTPNELYAVLTKISGAQNFIAGNTLTNVILDEVDVLLPPTPKALRTTFDSNGAQAERKKQEQKRKLRAAQRRGVEFQGGASIKGKSIDSMDLSNSMNSQILTPTERVLRLIAAGRYVGEQNDDPDRLQLQVLAGSATASRTTLDRLNKALRWAAMEGGVIGGGEGLEGVWKGRMKACRPAEIEGSGTDTTITDDTNDESIQQQQHTIRAVTVPSVVDHRYVRMTKDVATNAQEILTNVAKVTKKLQPKSSLLFICGEFSRSILKEKKREAPKVSGNTSQARRNAKRRRVFIENQKAKNSGANINSSGPEPLSVRKACSVLQSLGVDAQPMHVALGLEPNAAEEDDDVIPTKEEVVNDEVDLPPVLVTFEGSARGLHFDGVDIVFVVGRPTSAMSYLHLAGRIGRAKGSSTSTISAGEVEIQPGTIVSFCSKGRLKELEKWTNQVGATQLQEIVL